MYLGYFRFVVIGSWCAKGLNPSSYRKPPYNDPPLPADFILIPNPTFLIPFF